MSISRRRALALLGSAAVFPSCTGKSPNAVRVGSKNFTESFIVAEIYAQTLEKAGMNVERHMNLGSVQIVLSALQRGDIDLYPEYTGTALIDVLHRPPLRNSNAVFMTVAESYAAQYGFRWLNPSPMNNSQAFATTQTVATQFRLRTLSDLSQKAPQLRLATIPEFLSRADALPGLQKFYGGFRFKSVNAYDIGLKYEALLHGQADVATAFTTDGQIGANNLVVLEDDKHFWPAYNVAPVVRNATLHAHPAIATALNRISPFITDIEARQMNYAVDHDKRDPSDVAADFLKRHAV
ncbi:MAG: quaternary ammonium transporter [Candidatus Eremiobacteraeota bacterium]|nr:quaternary ammonium transporter [Candidatus Eremiobacteraeota bacterium]